MRAAAALEHPSAAVRAGLAMSAREAGTVAAIPASLMQG
jgi:hypothetical protein